MSDRTIGYADAMIAVAGAEQNIDAVKSQMADFAHAVQQNDELRTALGNRQLPAANRSQIVDDLLAGKALDTTRALIGMVVSAGRGSELVAITDAFISRAATASGRQVATVRTAVALTEDQKTRLRVALEGKVGGNIELQNVIDPTVVGGAVTTIGDTVIDGSVNRRLQQMRDTL